MTESDSFSWDLADDARIVALVHESSEQERSATVVDAIATAIGRQREHTLVIGTEPGPTPLDELAGAGASEGWPAFLAGRSGLTRVAVQRPECPWVYLSAGRDAEAATRFLEDEIFTRFLARVRERGGTLLLVISERTPVAPDLGRHLDGYVALGDMRRADSEEFAYYGRVRYEAEEASAGAAEATAPGPAEAHDRDAEERAAAGAASVPSPALEEELPGGEDEAAPDPDAEAPSDPLAARPRKRRARVGLVIALLIVAAAVTGGWFEFRNPGTMRGLFERLRSAVGEFGDREDPEPPAAPQPSPEPESSNQPESTSDPGAPAGAASTPFAGEPESSRADRGRSSPESGSSAAGPETSAAGPAASAAGPGASLDGSAARERPFSLLMGSFGDPADAARRADELRALSPETLYFTAPTPVGDVLYHRVFAGVFEGESGAAALMDEFVRGGAAEEVNPWQIRPVRFAYDLGTFADPAGAEARIAALAARGVPAYRLGVAVDGRIGFRVYVGAYEDAPSAAAMAAILEAAGETASLVARRGGEGPAAR